MRYLTIFILAIVIHFAARADTRKTFTDNFIEKVRPFFDDILGEEKTNLILGKVEAPTVDNSVLMPLIPKIVEDSKSLAVYTKSKDEIVLEQKIEESFYVNFLRELFLATRKETASDEELGQFYNVLTQGGTREGIYRSLVLDSRYAVLENAPGNAVKSNAADFAIFIYDKYANKKITKEKMKGMNEYSLKRIVTEKALDIIDAFGSDRDSVEAWYANLSSDLAFRFGPAFKNPQRKNHSSLYHQAWAKKVPLQHIKSEVIIKLHLAFNSMM